MGVAAGRFLLVGPGARALVLLVATIGDALIFQWLASVFDVPVADLTPLALALPRHGERGRSAPRSSSSSTAAGRARSANDEAPMRIYEDLRNVQSRLAVVQSVVVGLFLLLVIQFWNLQVVRGRYFRALAENNRSRAVSLAAPRGPAPRPRRARARGEPAVLQPAPEHRARGEPGQGRRAPRPRPPGRGSADPRAARAPHPLPDPGGEGGRHARGRGGRGGAPVRAAARSASRSCPCAPTRSPPRAAHALGRVGEISEKQLLLPEFEGLEPGALVGQAGLESQYNRQLMGKDGYRRVIVNSRGLEVAGGGAPGAPGGPEPHPHPRQPPAGGDGRARSAGARAARSRSTPRRARSSP